MDYIEEKFIDKKCDILPYKGQDSRGVVYLRLDVLIGLLNYDFFPSSNKFAGLVRVIAFLIEQSSRSCIYNVYEPFTVHSQIWKYYFTTDKYKAYQAMFEELKILKQVNLPNKHKYLAGNYATHFVFGERWFSGQIIKLFISTGRNKTTLESLSYKYEVFSYLLDDEEKIFIDIDDVNFDISRVQLLKEKAIKAEIEIYDSLVVKKKKALPHRLTAIENFNLKGNEITQGIRSNRLYHKITMLSRVTRKFLRDSKGRAYHCLDVVNCQPLLLCAVLKQYGYPCDLSYIEVCQDGVFYEQFNHFGFDRDEVKRKIYRTVLFSQKSYEAFNKAFRTLYPTTYYSLIKLTEQSEYSVAALLQQAESAIFNMIRGYKDDKSNFFTLFDAVYFSDKLDYNHFFNQIRAGFLEFRLNPNIKYEGANYI